jgi:hypothetical protein
MFTRSSTIVMIVNVHPILTMGISRAQFKNTSKFGIQRDCFYVANDGEFQSLQVF